MGKSTELLMSEIRINDIGNNFDLPILENHLIFRYRQIDFPISVIHFEFPISVNRPLYR